MIFKVTVFATLGGQHSFNVAAADDVQAREKAVALYKKKYGILEDRVLYCEVIVLATLDK